MNSKQIAEALGVTERQVRNLKKEEGFPVNGSLEEICNWHEEKKLTRDVSLDEVRRLKAALTEEQAALTKAKRQLAELELEREREGLVPMSEAKKAIYKTQLALRIQLEALGARICAECNPTDPDLAKEAIEDAVRQIFENLQNE